MKKQQKNLARLLMPLGLSSLIFAMLLCGLSQASQAIETKPNVSSAATSWGRPQLSSLDSQTVVSVCRQTENQVPDPGFDGPIGEQEHWDSDGGCLFDKDEFDGYEDSGAPSAIIFAPSGGGECKFFTLREEIPALPNEFYDYSAWIKTEALQGNAYLRIIFWKWQKSPPRWVEAEPPTRTQSVTNTYEIWNELSGSAQAPPDAEYVTIEAVLEPELGDTSARVWFDDVFLGSSICLECSKHDDPDQLTRAQIPGQALTYTIVCSNTGREKATNVQILEDYDEDVDYVDAYPLPDFSNYLWQPGNLDPGTSHTITIWVDVESSAENWLFNGVRVFSNETISNPVDITISTPISPAYPPTTCKLAPYIPENHKLGLPGDLTDYEVELRNTGTCGGQVDLVATSQKGWTVTVDPPPSYTLPAGDWEDVIVSPNVPLGTPAGITDTTFITATLVCGSPCDEQVTETTMVTTTVRPWGIEPCLHLSATGLSFLAAEDGANPNPKSVVISNCRNGRLDWCASWSEEWLTISPTTGTAFPSSTILVSVSIAGMTLDMYSDVITIDAYSGTQSMSQTVEAWLHIVSGEIYLPLVLRDWSPFWEHGNNNRCEQANGPLLPDTNYYGRHDDSMDYFRVFLRSGDYISANLTTDLGQGVQLQLCDPDCKLVGGDNCYDWEPPYQIGCTIAGATDWYYIGVGTASPDESKTYTLRATFPQIQNWSRRDRQHTLPRR